MIKPIDKVAKAALALPPRSRAKLAERILASLDRPDRAMDELWAEEAESRIQAFEDGKLKAISAEEVFRSLRSRRPA